MKNTIVLSVAVAVILFISGSQAYSRFCNGIWKPTIRMPWMWQIYNTPSTADIDKTSAQVIDLDMYNTPTSLIDYIHAKGKAVICYIDTQYEDGRPDSALFTASLKGKGIEGWEGQFWVDIRSPVISSIMYNRAKLAQSKGCDAIEWDDVDGYANPSGFDLKYEDQIAFNKNLANITHSLGMSVGLKNDLDQVKDLVNYFDWALNEECYAIGECDVLQAFVKQNKAVFGTEYTGDSNTFCPIQNKNGYSWLLSDIDLNGNNVVQCCSVGSKCAKVAYQCTNANGTNIAHDESENLPSSSSSLSPVAMFFVAIIASFLAAAF